MASVSSQTNQRIRPADFEVVPATQPPLRQGEPVALQMSDGAVVRGEWLCRTERPCAVVALSHAMMVDRRTLDAKAGEGLLSSLLDRGLKVLWFDQRGHGQSRPTATEGASWDYDSLVYDAGCVAAYLAQAEPSLPRIAVGHSLFGHVSLAWQSLCAQNAELTGYDGLVGLASNVWLRHLEPSLFRWWLKRLSYETLLLLSRPTGYFPAVRLRFGNVNESLPYLAQMGSWVSGGDWTDRHGRSYRAGLPKVRVPILSVAGHGDRLMAIPGCQLRFVLETAGPITHWQLGRRFGDEIDPDHMQVVMSSKLKERWNDVAAWIATPGRFRTSGGQGR